MCVVAVAADVVAVVVASVVVGAVAAAVAETVAVVVAGVVGLAVAIAIVVAATTVSPVALRLVAIGNPVFGLLVLAVVCCDVVDLIVQSSNRNTK